MNTLKVFVLVDRSEQPEDTRAGFDAAFEDLLGPLLSAKQAWGEAPADLQVGLIEFSKGAWWATPPQMAYFGWVSEEVSRCQSVTNLRLQPEYQASVDSKQCDLGAAIELLCPELSKEKNGAYPYQECVVGVILFLANKPTDDWESKLEIMNSTDWGKRGWATRLAVVLGEDTLKETVTKFTGNMETVFGDRHAAQMSCLLLSNNVEDALDDEPFFPGWDNSVEAPFHWMRIGSRVELLANQTKLRSYRVGAEHDEGVVGIVVQHPTNPNRLGIRNRTFNTVWTFLDRDGELQQVHPGQHAPLFTGLELNFGACLGQVGDLSELLSQCSPSPPLPPLPPPPLPVEGIVHCSEESIGPPPPPPPQTSVEGAKNSSGEIGTGLIVYFLICTSDSVESVIGSLNRQLERTLEDIRLWDTQDDAPRPIQVQVIEFSTGVRLQNAHKQLTSDFELRPLASGGDRNLGAALEILYAILPPPWEVVVENMRVYGPLNPIVFLVMDGDPTDEWKVPLERLEAAYPHLDRYAFFIDENTDREPLQRFVGETRRYTSPDAVRTVLYTSPDAVRPVSDFGARASELVCDPDWDMY